MITIGNNCPKCHKPMQRRSHPVGWRPKPNQPYYFNYWDFCNSCRHLQHYETAKVMINKTNNEKPISTLTIKSMKDKPLYIPPPSPSWARLMCKEEKEKPPWED